MFAAAGGASLAKRQARRNVRNKQHQQQLQHPVELHPHPPGPPRLAALAPPQQLLQPRLSTASAHHLYRAPSHRRLSSYTDFNGRIVGFGSIELAEGKAAWQERERERERGERGERERRASACEAGINHRLKSTEARRRWMRRNRIHDTAFGGSSSDEDDIPFPFGHESAAANALLYVGLGTVAIGMVIAFVGTGEKGFKTLELRLIGPTLIVGGLLCILLRVMLCVCPSKCLLRRFRQRSRHKKQQMALEAAGRIAMGPCRALHNRGIRGSSRPPSRSSRPTSRTSRPPSRGSRAPSELARSPSDPADPSVSGGARGKKRVSIASGNAGVHRPGTGTAGLAGQSQVLAATSLFLQNEQQANSSCSSKSRFNVPSINLPSLVRGRSEDLGDSGNGSRRLSQASKRLGSTGDLPLLAAMDADPEGSFNSAFSPDDATAAGPSNAAQSTPHAIIVTSPTPSSSPRPAPRPTPRSAPRPAREIILSPGGLQ